MTKKVYDPHFKLNKQKKQNNKKKRKERGRKNDKGGKRKYFVVFMSVKKTTIPATSPVNPDIQWLLGGDVFNGSRPSYYSYMEYATVKM